MLPPTSTLFQDIPYGQKRKHNEGHKVAHVPTTALGHHGVYPTKSASKQTPSIEHLPFHATNQVILTAHLLLSATKSSKRQTHARLWGCMSSSAKAGNMRQENSGMLRMHERTLLVESIKSTSHQRSIFIPSYKSIDASYKIR